MGYIPGWVGTLKNPKLQPGLCDRTVGGRQKNQPFKKVTICHSAHLSLSFCNRDAPWINVKLSKS